jgi:hypothetical protein
MENVSVRKVRKSRARNDRAADIGRDLDIYIEQTTAFRKKFGRDMGPDDPFFFDAKADTPRFPPPEQAGQALDQMAMLMGQAGVDAASIYAFKKTGGLFPTSTAGLSPDEIAEWTAAWNEYHAKLHATATQ